MLITLSMSAGGREGSLKVYRKPSPRVQITVGPRGCPLCSDNDNGSSRAASVVGAPSKGLALLIPQCG